MFPDSRCIITRDAFEGARDIAYGEVKKWIGRMRFKIRGKMQAAGVKDSEQHYIRVLNPERDEGFSGTHGEHVLFWFDEATAVPRAFFDMMDTQAHKFIATANPRTVAGPFRNAFPKGSAADKTQTVLSPHGKRRLITVSGLDCTNVRLKRLDHASGPVGGIVDSEGRRYEHGEPIPRDVWARDFRPIIPGQTGYDKFRGLVEHPDPVYRNCMAYGRFPEADPDTRLFESGWFDEPAANYRRWARLYDIACGREPRRESRVWWEKAGARIYPGAVRRLEKLLPIQAVGVDVGASDEGDNSVLYAGGRRGVRPERRIQTRSLTEVGRWVVDTLAGWGVDLTAGVIPVGIDTAGVGHGLSSILRERGVFVVECLGNAATSEPKKYGNARAERYARTSDLLNPDSPERMAYLPENELLAEELLAHNKRFASGDGMRFYVTPKNKPPGTESKIETVKQRLGRSPDRADAFTYMLEAAQHVGVDLSEWLDNGAI